MVEAVLFSTICDQAGCLTQGPLQLMSTQGHIPDTGSHDD